MARCIAAGSGKQPRPRSSSCPRRPYASLVSPGPLARLEASVRNTLFLQDVPSEMAQRGGQVVSGVRGPMGSHVTEEIVAWTSHRCDRMLEPHISEGSLTVQPSSRSLASLSGHEWRPQSPQAAVDERPGIARCFGTSAFGQRGSRHRAIPGRSCREVGGASYGATRASCRGTRLQFGTPLFRGTSAAKCPWGGIRWSVRFGLRWGGATQAQGPLPESYRWPSPTRASL